MASIKELKKQIADVNALGRECLEIMHGVELPEAATTCDVVKSIYNLPPLSCATNIAKLFYGGVFPWGYELVLNVPFITELSKVFENTQGLKKITLKGRTPQIANATGLLNCDNTFSSNSDLEIIDITDFYFNPGNIDYIVNNATSLREIRGTIYANNTKSATYAFYHCPCLEEMRVAEDSVFGMLEIPNSPLLSSETVQSLVDSLKTMTGFKGNMVLNSQVVARMTDTQKATVYNKGWTLVGF